MERYIDEASMLCNDSYLFQEIENEKNSNQKGPKYHLRTRQVHHNCESRENYFEYDRNKYGDRYPSKYQYNQRDFSKTVGLKRLQNLHDQDILENKPYPDNKVTFLTKDKLEAFHEINLFGGKVEGEEVYSKENGEKTID